MSHESPSSITADIISVDHLFKRNNGVLYATWRTSLLKHKLGQNENNPDVDRREDYSLWRAHLLTSNPAIQIRHGKRSYLLEQHADNKKKENQPEPDEVLETPNESPEITPEPSFEEEEDEEDKETLNNKVNEQERLQTQENEESNSSEETPKPRIKKKIKRKVVMTPERAEAIKRAKAIAKKKKQAQLLKEKRKKRAESTVELPGGGRVSDAYAFTGMHHIWDEHHEAVTRILFANYNNTLLAFGGFDGDISICYALPEPYVHLRIQGHTQCVTDLSFSSSNELLMSSSVDHTLRVWNVSDGECIRTIEYSEELICCSFHPFNNNLLFAGTINGYLNVYNLSTGQLSQQLDFAGAVNTLTWEPTGTKLFAGDAKGYIYIFEFDQTTGKVSKTSKATAYGRFSRSRPIVSIQYKAWSNSPQHRPEILVSCQDNSLKLFNVASNNTISFKKEFKNIPNSSYRVRSCFCPLISLRDGACVVTGGEDMKIRIFDVLRTEKPCVNELMGHCGPVLDVCWNHEETLMGSCDSTGTVILWKRVKITKETD